MKLLRLYVINNGIFKRDLIDFTDHNQPQDLLCLSGVNGSGKTTVMELILNLMWFLNPKITLRDLFIDRLKPNILTRTEFAQLDLLIDGKVLSLVWGSEEHIQSVESKDNQQVFIIESEIHSLVREFEDAIKAEGENKEAFSIEMKRAAYFEHKFASRLRKIIDKEGILSSFLQEMENHVGENFLQPAEMDKLLPLVYFFNAHDREILDIRYEWIPEYKFVYEVTHRYSPKRDDLKKLLVFHDYAYQGKFEELKSWINAHVLEDKTLDKIHRPEFKVVIKTKAGDEHGLELLSSGEASLLLLTTLIYLHASTNTLVLIDEIDQSLHPQYQQKVMRILKQLQPNQQCQIMVASHSRFIWDAFEESSRIRLTKSG
jgi:ABC-type cobalamin/Fe3+-siderophores transport system ATPase subunit